MTLSNITSAERIVIHEQNITTNIQQIEMNQGLIETQELAYQDLLAEKNALNNQDRSFIEVITFDDSLQIQRDETQQAMLLSKEQTTNLKLDTYALKLETLAEIDQLEQAQLDQKIQLEQNISELEDATSRSEDRLNRLENYNEQNPERIAAHTENIEQERAVLVKREQDLAALKQEAEEAQQATQARNTKVADDVKESCPIKCYANTLNVKSSNGDRNYTLKASLNEPNKTLHVISASQKALDKISANSKEKGANSIGMSTISASLIGKCEKGLPDVSLLSKDQLTLQRQSDQHCPVVVVNKHDIDLSMPGTDASPLMFHVFCPSPPEGMITWGYLFRDILFPEYRTPPITYPIESKGCDGSYPLTAMVAAHQKIKLELELGITYKKTESIQTMKGWKFNPEAKNLVEDYNKGHRTVELGNWLFTIDLKGKVDYTNLAAQVQFLNPADCLSGLRTAINGFIFLFDIIRICTNDNLGSNITGIEYLADKIIDNKVDAVDDKGIASAEGPTGSISIVYPKMALNVTYENCEAAGKNILGHSTSVAIKFTPLIGVACKVDILSALIKIASNALMPGAATGGKAFVKFIWPIIKELTKESGVGTQMLIDEDNKDYFLNAGISLTMDIGANISCEGKFTHIKDASTLGEADVEPEIPPENKSPVTTTDSTSLEIKLEGKVWVKGKVWVIEFEAGLILALGAANASGAAKMEYKVNLSEIDAQIMAEGQFEWNGLALFYQSYKTVAVKQKDNDEVDDSKQFDEFGDPIPVNTDSEVVETTQEVDTRKQWVIIQPGKTPDTPDKIALDDYLFSFTKPVKKAFNFFRGTT
ncbi:hypothetical protein N8878_01520 [Psychromonas sp.]|nr:hypothetical protein [Psychromonas sp.]